jgi:hypothetical protein
MVDTTYTNKKAISPIFRQKSPQILRYVQQSDARHIPIFERRTLEIKSIPES